MSSPSLPSLDQRRMVNLMTRPVRRMVHRSARMEVDRLQPLGKSQLLAAQHQVDFIRWSLLSGNLTIYYTRSKALVQLPAVPFPIRRRAPFDLRGR